MEDPRRPTGRPSHEMLRDEPGEYCYVQEPHAQARGAAADDSSSASMPAPGAVVSDRYRIERVLQSGNMGVLFAAHDLRLDIPVALKFIRRDMACPEATDRLLAEARSAARISHPSAVRVLDVGTGEHGYPFLVMELLHGITLADALAARRRLSPEDAISILLPVVDAVAAAHAENIVHRDIKPQNIFLATGENGALLPKLVDFGIARRTDEPPHRRITQVGALVGSPEYMAPEQTLGRSDVDAQADVWALCIVLYELVTGTTPFRRGSPLATLTAIQTEPLPPARELHAEPELWSILSWGLAKQRSKRCATALDLGKAMASWALGRGIESDAATMSLSAHWLRRPSSAPPPRRS